MSSLKISGALIFTLLFWASAFVGIRIGLSAYSPGALALFRFLVASLCMALIYAYLPNKKKITWPERLQLLILGIAGIGIYNLCLNYGETTVSAGVASFIIGLMPVITLILSVIYLKERPTAIIWCGVVISFIGLVLMILGESGPARLNHGVLIILISSLMGAIYTISQKRYLQRYHPVAVTAWVLWGGTLFLMPFAPQLWQEMKVANHQATLAAIYMGIFPAALAYVAWSYLLNHWSASKASMYLYALPVLSTLLGFLLLHERPSILSLIGGLFALTGALLANGLQTIRFLLNRKRRDEGYFV